MELAKEEIKEYVNTKKVKKKKKKAREGQEL